LIFNVADLWPDSARKLGLLENELIPRIAEGLESWIYRGATYVSAVTEGIRSTLQAEKGVSEDEILFLPNGVDTQLFRPQELDPELESELGLEGKWVVLYAGTHGYAHGLDVALEAADRLRDTDVMFVFIGGGSEKPRLEDKASTMELQNALFLDPAQPEYVARLYSVADAGLSTLGDSPLFEGTRPAKVMVSMSAGVPVLYSGQGEGASLVERADAGLVTPPQDAEALAQAVMRLREDASLVERLGRNGRAFAETHLSWDVLVERWVSELRGREEARSRRLGQ
jgi:glycosyltransferase involved in cell wall biosynthesis